MAQLVQMRERTTSAANRTNPGICEAERTIGEGVARSGNRREPMLLLPYGRLRAAPASANVAMLQQIARGYVRITRVVRGISRSRSLAIVR